VSEEQIEQPQEQATKAEEKAKKAEEKAKKAEKKGKKADKGASPSTDQRTIALAGHPRALRAIARLRSRGALGSAVFVSFLSHTAGVPLDHCILRGLTAGIVGYFVGWYVGVTVWRQLIRAELRVAYAKRAEELAQAGDA
jgi:hypothetical protein